MEPLEDEFGDIIQKARMGLGFTLRQIAEKASIQGRLLEDLESYRYIPPREEVDSLSKVLDLDPHKLWDSAMGLWHPEEILFSDVLVVAGAIGSYKVNGYIFIDKDSGEAAAFDTANDSRKILQSLKDRGLRLKYIFITHCHSDHISGLEEICRATGAGIGIPEGEPSIALSRDIGRCIFFVKDNSEFKLGTKVIRAVYTPGHTPGSTCYITQDYCFSGDTIFAGSIGRAYSTEGYNKLLHFVKTSILSLDERIRIFPGHGYATTVGEEIMHNPFF